MPLEFGSDGLKTQSLAEIIAEREAEYRDKYGDSFVLDESTEVGKSIRIEAEAELNLQEGLQFAYNSSFRSTSEGVQLDRQLELTGQARQGATKSTVVEYIRGTPGQAIIAEALQVTVSQTGIPFINPASANIGSLGQKSVTSITQILGVATVTIAAGHSFPDASFVFIEGAEQDGYNKLVQITAITGTTFDYLVDPGTVSPATGTITAYEASPIPMESIDTGEQIALAGTLINIVGSVPGVQRAENALDATLGLETETDPEAKSNADATVTQAGGGFREAIIAKLLNTLDVISATLFSNVSNITDPDGRPPGSVECFVGGGTDEDVANSVFNSVSDGIQTFGNVPIVVVDSQGQPIDISFSRLVERRIFVDVTITKNTDPEQGGVYPGNGDDQVKAALALIQFSPGQDLWETTLKNAITSAVPGIVTLVVKFDLTAAPTNTAPISIPPTEFANIDSTDVAVTS